MKKMTPEELEKFIHQQLRGLPVRRAPVSLESRVFAAIEQQAGIPWYHKSWNHWPAAVRALFLVSATLVTAGVIAAFYLMSREVDAISLAAGATHRFVLVTQIYNVGAWMVDFAGRIVGNVPPLWFYGSVATLAALYATFFGLGAAAYRTLYRRN